MPFYGFGLGSGLKKSFPLLLVLFMPALIPLFSQEFVQEEGDPAAMEAYPRPCATAYDDSDRLFVIAAFEFDIRGRTRPNALIHNGDLRTGEELQGRAGLESYIRDRTQVLTNMRVLRDTVEITYSIGERLEDGAYPVTIIVRVEDTWNIIALPVPYYDTNTGLDLTVRARDYNFLGTMSPLRIDLGYQLDENMRSSFRLMVDSSIPFTAWGYRWNFRFENVFEYRPDTDEPFFFRNITGLSAELPFRTTTLTVGFEESFILNDENPRRYRDEFGRFQSGLYMSSRFFASWRIPTGLTVGNYGELTYTLGPSVTFNHELPGWPLHDFRIGPFAGFSHSLGFGRINWHGNHRRGFSASLNNSYRFDFFRQGNIEESLTASLSVNGTGHFIVNRYLGISVQLQHRHWFHGYHDEAGDVLRGIADRAMHADYILSLNMDFPIRVLMFTPSQWFDSNTLRFFDFESHVSPVLDIAFLDDPRTGREFAVAGGFELVVFPEFMRALYLRLSVGWNLRELFSTGRLPTGNGREISFGLGHFF